MANLVIPDGGTIGSTSDTDALTITNTGVVKASQSIATSTIKDATGVNNSISIATNGEATFAENIKITNGKGIDFSAVSGSASGSASAVLDDYEEGTWTPTWVVATGSITAHSHVSGFYRKIGNVVYIWGYISYGSHSGTSNSDSLRVGGLPYTSITSGFGQSSNQAGGVHMFAEGLWGSDAPQGGRITNNSTEISITHSRTGTGSSNVTVGDMTKSQITHKLFSTDNI